LCFRNGDERLEGRLRLFRSTNLKRWVLGAVEFKPTTLTEEGDLNRVASIQIPQDALPAAELPVGKLSWRYNTADSDTDTVTIKEVSAPLGGVIDETDWQLQLMNAKKSPYPQPPAGGSSGPLSDKPPSQAAPRPVKTAGHKVDYTAKLPDALPELPQEKNEGEGAAGLKIDFTAKLPELSEAESTKVKAEEQAAEAKAKQEKEEKAAAAATAAAAAAATKVKQAEAARVAAEKAEAERVAAEQAEAERVAAEEAEATRVAAEQAEAARVAAEQAEALHVAVEQAEAARVAAEQAEAARVVAEAARVVAEADNQTLRLEVQRLRLQLQQLQEDSSDSDSDSDSDHIRCSDCGKDKARGCYSKRQWEEIPEGEERCKNCLGNEYGKRCWNGCDCYNEDCTFVHY
jgi:hypothetical protein